MTIQFLKDVMNNMKAKSQTKGREKMLRYINELIRNKNFKRLLKKLKSLEKYEKIPEGSYYGWTNAEKAKHDHINDELDSIIAEYENLRKRCRKLLKTKAFGVKEDISSLYGLDNDTIYLADATLRKDKDAITFMQGRADPDMCRLHDPYFEELTRLNPGDEIIHLNPTRQLLFTAYPVSIMVHQRASKRDVVDFIEKKWPLLDQLRDSEEGILRLRKRKYTQELLDFIWENQSLPSRKLIDMIEHKFPQYSLEYYELSKLISLERQRRTRKLM